jgi:hypothetical protein
MGQLIRKSILLLIIASTMLAACADFRARENLRHGLLALELSQRDFLSIWGNPTHTSAISGDEIIKSGIAGWGGFFLKGREMYEMWEYEDRQTKLVFYSQMLMAWKTALTVQKLAVPEPDYGDAPEGVEAEATPIATPTAASTTAPAAAPPQPAHDSAPDADRESATEGVEAAPAAAPAAPAAVLPQPAYDSATDTGPESAPAANQEPQ